MGGGMTEAADERGYSLGELRGVAAELFREKPQLRSVMFAVAQYWNDQADDEVHAFLVASPREVPVWPHFCDDEYRDLGEPTPGEMCSDCAYPLGYVSVGVRAFERFCHEYGNQDRHPAGSYLPYAIARRGAGDGEVRIDIVGKLVRPAHDMIPDERDTAKSWLALPRARDLYELVCASPADDGPRRVLGDYLLEHDHPRGELIALSLAEHLDEAARERRDGLLAAYGRRWISPLGAVIPETGAHWERGFLARTDVYAKGDVAAVRGAPAWGTVETIRFLGGTELIDPAMVALRDVGPVRAGLGDLAAARRPWAIERLHAVLDDDAAIDALWGARTLPRLSHLVIAGSRLDRALARPRPAWWPQLARLTLWLGGRPDDDGDDDDGDRRLRDDADHDYILTPAQRVAAAIAEGTRAVVEGAAALEARRAAYEGAAPWVAVARRSSVTGEPGWEVATGPDGRIAISLTGWHEGATFDALREIARAVPPEREIWLAPSPYWAPDADLVGRLAEAANRAISLAPQHGA
jgi:uncharacterized protein (TIGR02996 family)